MNEQPDRPLVEEPWLPAPGSPWQRLDPRSMIVQPLGLIKAGGLPAIIAIGGIASQLGWFTLLAAPVLLALAILVGLLTYLSTSFIVTDRQLRVRRGLVNRTTLTANLDKVRSVDLEAPLLHRLIGLSRVEIGTGVDETRIELDSLDTEQARQLRQLLLRRTSELEPAVATEDGSTARPPEAEEISRLNPRWAWFAPLKLGGLAVFAGAFGAISQSIDRERLNDLESADELWQWLQDQALLAVVAAVVLLGLIAWVMISVGAYLVRWWQLRLVRTSDTLRLTAGLFTTRSTSIEFSRIRGLRVTRAPLVRRAGGGELASYATGVQAGVTTILPAAPLAEVRRVGAELLADEAPLTRRLLQHGPAAFARLRFRGFAAVGLLAAVLAVVTVSIALEPAGERPGLLAIAAVDLLIVAGAALLSWGAVRSTYAHLGHSLTARHLVAGHGMFTDVREALETDGIIGWVIRQSYFQRRRGLAHLVATTAAGPEQVVVRDLPRERAVALADAATPGMLTEFLAVSESART